MKDTEKLQQTYELLLDLVEQGKNGLASIEANKYTVEKLEQLTTLGWENEAGEELFKILMLCRKEKLNSQFIFDNENIGTIIHIDQQLRICCQILKKELENEFFRLLERKKADKNFIPYICGFITINAGESLLELSLSLNENLLSFSITIHGDNLNTEKIDQLSLFDFKTNYADKIESSNNKLTSCHIGYAFYTLYSQSYLCLQDIVEIVGIEGEIKSRYHFSSYKKFK